MCSGAIYPSRTGGALHLAYRLGEMGYVAGDFDGSTGTAYFFDFVNWVVIRKAGGQRPLRFVPGTTYEPIRELARRANLDRVMRQHRRQRLRRTIESARPPPPPPPPPPRRRTHLDVTALGSGEAIAPPSGKP